MTRSRKSALSLGALVLTAGALTLLAPKAAHAVAAALVQVTNTVANPALTQSINSQAAQILDVACVETSPGGSSGCATVSPGATYSPFTYAVPANQTFVVTGVDIEAFYTTTPSQCAGATSLAVTTDRAFRKSWTISGANTVHYAYPSGFQLGPGQTLGLYVAPGAACPATIEMHGYLTAN